MPHERAWYQNGWVMLIVAAVAASIAYVWLNPKQEPALLSVAGVVHEDSDESGVFQLRCRHFFPGTLAKGRLTAALQGSPVEAGEQIELHAFDEWPPNEEGAVTLEFPLSKPAEDAPLSLSIQVTAANAQDTFYETEWRGGRWSKPLRRVEASDD